MRPEYLTAVDSVRWGASLGVALVMPAAVVWFVMLRYSRRRLAAVLGLVLASSLFCLLGRHHGARIDAAKERYAQTAEEIADLRADTWHPFAFATLIPFSILYCSIHAATAFGVARVWLKLEPGGGDR